MAIKENRANNVPFSGTIRGSQGACKGQSFCESFVMAEDLVTLIAGLMVKAWLLKDTN